MSVLINASTSTGLVQSADTSGEIELQSNGTTALKVNTNEGIQILNCLGVGNATPSTSGAGITFPATQSASTDANTLDDYEEGTWTPNVGGNATYTVQVGRYVKVGSQVTAWGQMWINVLGTGSTEIISGLPFTSANITDNLGSGGVSFFSSLAINQIAIYLRVEPNASTVRTATMSASASGVTNSPSIFGNSTRMAFVVTYIAA
jgi:hypothetical protein